MYIPGLMQIMRTVVYDTKQQFQYYVLWALLGCVVHVWVRGLSLWMMCTNKCLLPLVICSRLLKWLPFVWQFLVLDEADRVLDVNFEEELRVIFSCLPKKRQTFLFSATMSDNLRSLLELSGNKSYFFEAYEGFKTVETLKQHYIHLPQDGKELHLSYILSKMKDKEDSIHQIGEPIRSAIVFVSQCKYATLRPWTRFFRIILPTQQLLLLILYSKPPVVRVSLFYLGPVISVEC